MLIIDPCLPDQSRSTKCRTNSTWSLHHQITLLVVLSLAGLVTVSGWFKESSDKIRNQMLLIRICISSVQSLSCVWLFATAWTAAHRASLSITVFQSFLKLISIESVMPSNHLILCHPLLLPSIFPSIKVFSNKSVLHIRWSEYWSYSFSISSCNGYSDWFPLGLTGWISLQSKGLSKVFSNSTVQKPQFFSTQLSLLSNSHIHTWLLQKPQFWLDGPLLAK